MVGTAMKIVCECGNKVEIIEDPDSTADYYDSKHAMLETYGKIDLHAEHDELWITCNKCNKSYHLFT
jgi:hypothetical protein